ncbi:MAG: hypothetical protein ACOYK6_00025 [Chthoniobacterales bacterium]
MIAALPLQGASLPTTAPHAALANNLNVNAPVDPNHVDATTVHQTSATTPQQPTLPNDIDAFYTVGYDSIGIGFQPAMMNPHHMQQFHDTEAYHGHQGNGGGGSFQDAAASQENNGDSNYTNSSNLFTDSVHFLQKQGGPSDPLAMFKLQAEIIETTLNWSLYGQMASKAVSGIQSLFNNQV